MHPDYTNEFRRKWEELEESFQKKEQEEDLKEGCVGGVCTIGGNPSGTSQDAGSGGTRVSSVKASGRMPPWRRRELDEEKKEEEFDQEPDHVYDPVINHVDPTVIDQEELHDVHKNYVHDGELEAEENWTQKKLEETFDNKPIETIDPLEYFNATGESYDIMIKARGKVLPAEEWYRIIQQEMKSQLEPEVPDLDHTEGGYEIEKPAETSSHPLNAYPETGGFPDTGDVRL